MELGCQIKESSATRSYLSCQGEVKSDAVPINLFATVTAQVILGVCQNVQTQVLLWGYAKSTCNRWMRCLRSCTGDLKWMIRSFGVDDEEIIIIAEMDVNIDPLSKVRDSANSILIS